MQKLKLLTRRLRELKRILKENGSIYVHTDTRVNSYIRIKLDEIFGYDNMINEISWNYKGGGHGKKRFSPKHDTIYWYGKGNDYTFNDGEARVP